MLLQAVQESHAIEAIVVGVMLGAGKLWDHFKGRKRDRSSTTALTAIRDDLREVKDDVRDLRAFVVGPDGQNGLRGDVREIKSRVIGLEERERDRLHGPYVR
jgi:hypothetical protein